MPSAGADTCCSGRLFPRDGDRTECTDGVAHRPNETVCNGQIYLVSGGQCCGTVLMDPVTEICCQGQ